jgi:hypothetical protein
MKKNSLKAFEGKAVKMESVKGGQKVIQTTMTNGNCDEVTLCGLFKNTVDSTYEQPFGL